MSNQSQNAGVVLPGEGRRFASGRSHPQVKIEFSTANTFAAIEADQAPGVPGPPAHVHRVYDESWYVLEGTMEFLLDGRTYSCPAGSVIFAPRGTAHTFHNPGPESARMFAVVTAAALPLLEELGELVAAGAPDIAEVHSVLARHETYNVDDPGPFTAGRS